MRYPVALILIACAAFHGCAGESGSSAAPQVGTDGCSIDNQKQYVLERMRELYLWQDLLPATVDLAAYATPEALLDYLISFQPLDNFSYIDSADADAEFFGEGRYRGFGFSTRFESADDFRFTQVFESGPAFAAGFERGQRIVMLNGRTIADIEANEGVGALFTLPALDFTIRRLDGSEFTTTVNTDIVTIDPVPQYRIIDRPDGSSVGYLELSTFINTADSAFELIFPIFRNANVTDVVIDLRYNGGGLVVTTELLGDYFGGGVPGEVFSNTLFNDLNSAANRVERFESVASSLNLSRLVVIATDRTASASELITNSMFPHAEVSIVGSTTLGKPVGQLGLLFCDKILRPTAFQTTNADDEGEYFDGLPADCEAPDDLAIAVGDDADPNLISALTLLETGACPAVTSAPSGAQKSHRITSRERPQGPPWREFAGAW